MWFLNWMVATICFFLPLSAFAQSPGPASPERDFGWFTFGAGIAAPYDLSGAVTANYGRERIVQIGFYATTDFMIGNQGPGVSALSVSLGRSLVGRVGRMAFLVGPGLMGITRGYSPGGDSYDRSTVLGIVTSGQFILTPVKELGLGLNVFALLNMKKSAVGMSLAFVFEGNK